MGVISNTLVAALKADTAHIAQSVGDWLNIRNLLTISLDRRQVPSHCLWT